MPTHPALISIAPMMDYTDRHFRYFLRLLSRHMLLYTEMINMSAIVHGNRDRLLKFDATEHPVALQIGGSDPQKLAQAARIGEDYGYDEINLNVGCPSDRVQAGRFGACLMKEPQLVADCVATMRNAVKIPITVKHRIGVDEQDSYAELGHFIETVTQAGCNTFIVHARKAWLKGLSPKENREIPPLQYETVYQLKKDFPKLSIILNGGIKDLDAVKQHLFHVDGTMLGRLAYTDPYVLTAIDARLYGCKQPQLSRIEILTKFIPYVAAELQQGTRLLTIIRHIFGLFRGEPCANAWRRYLSENAWQKEAGIEVLEKAVTLML